MAVTDEKFETTEDILEETSKTDPVGTTFSLMLQNKGLAQFGKVDGEMLSGNYDAESEVASGTFGDVTVTLTGVDPKTFKVSTHKLLDVLLILFTQNTTYGTDEPETQVSFAIDEYLRLTNTPVTKSSRDKKRKQLNLDLDILYSLSLDYETPDKQKVRRERICTDYQIINSQVVFTFNSSLARTLVKSYFTALPTSLLALPNNNQNAYYIGKKLAEHSTNRSNRAADRHNILSVKKILEACPSIPTIEEARGTNRNFTARIKNPFVKALDILKDLNIVDWHFCNAQKVPLTDEQKENFDFRTFMNSYVYFELLENKDGELKVFVPNSPKKRKPKKNSERA